MKLPAPRLSRLLLLSLATAAPLAAAVPPAQDDAAPAAVRMAAVFSDHMVLQRDADAPLWGWAPEGTVVTVSADWPDAQAATAVAGEDGRFQVTLRTGAAGGPYTVRVVAGETILEIADVLLGEVWVASGQSNMEWPMKASDIGSATLEASSDAPPNLDRPQLRFFRVARQVAAAPVDDVRGSWQVCSPTTAPDFSAVAFHYASILQDELQMPVGILQTAWGGTPAEAWSPPGVVEQMPGQYHALQRVQAQAADPRAVVGSQEEAQQLWWQDFEAVDPGMRAGWAAPSVQGEERWPAMELPGYWEESPHRLLHDYDGVCWFRRKVEIPADWAGRELVLELGPVDDMDWVWFDGELVGGTVGSDAWNRPRRYTVPAEQVEAGEVAIAVRVLDSGGAGGFSGEAEAMRLYPADADPAEASLPLAGTWGLRQGLPRSAQPVQVRVGPLNQNSPTALWNGMVAPLVPYAMRGAIWYQGESNRMRWMEYRMLFYSMIAGWREAWGGDVFPFYYVQIAPFNYGGDQGQAAKLREAQTFALSQQATGMVTTMDIGNPADIHPRNKHEVGRRLALWAMRDTYGREGIVPSGPVYQSFAVEDGGLRTAFRFTAERLVAPEGLTLFEVAGADGVWHPATATIAEDGQSVYVKSEAVPAPVQVRYAWGAADEAELFNSAGLPAPSFRSHQ